jgi:DMSO/TMAO reductase YedYZ molybdopterin-dependent catalytic subunit
MQPIPEPPSPTSLPVHPVPELPNIETWQLVLQSGDRSLTLDPDAVAQLPHVELADTFTCLEGWTTGPLRWRGVPLSALLESLGGAARGWLAVSAPDFRSVIPLAELPAETLLADGLDGRPLPREHGGPLRLVAPGSACYRSVKWVQRIELQDTDAGDTSQAIARARLRREGG